MRSSKRAGLRPQAPSPKPRLIVIVTGSRAEFGLLEPVMRAVDEHEALELAVVVAGMHLVTGTWRDVKAAGFDIAARVPMQKKSETGRAADVAAVGRGITGFGKVFEKLRPDFVVVLGDRVEVLAAATAGHIGGWRVAHLHGGDRAEGVADEAMRHATSKLAHLHLPATVQSRQRLIRMGEDWQHVIRVGSPAMDGLSAVEADPDAPTAIVLQHPVGGTDAEEEQWMRATLRAVFGECGKKNVMVMAPNGDAGCHGIRRAIAKAKVAGVEHLPRAEWLSTLRGAKVVVGNSSAGLIEAAALKTACVNIGPRQNGREKPGNVVDCQYRESSVRAALAKALSLQLARLRHPYGNGQTGARVAEALANVTLETMPLRKRNTY
jgi:UDP-hydrolysing UDP-N-acetyl-D-glucosamine 2-epimerase